MNKPEFEKKMAKKEQKRSRVSRLPIFLLILGLGVGGWLAWNYSFQWKDILLQYVENGEVLTLESHYTPEQIMASHRAELIGNNSKRVYQDASLVYYPHLLLDVKFTEDKNSKEGTLLWGLTDGELVLNTDTWETTRGFKDCLECRANRYDFKILQALAKNKGPLTFEGLQNELHIERELLEIWIEEAKSKHLIIQKGNSVQMHFENPKILVTPRSLIKQHFVSKPITGGQRVVKTYSRGQMIELTKALFGSDLKIRNEQEIFLPVFSINVLNPDGSMHTSEWNAVTGQRINPSYLKL